MPNTRDNVAATHHFVNKAIGDLRFPATKSDVVKKAGDAVIPLNGGREATLKEIMDIVAVNEYSCAAEFYCALSASLLKDEKKRRV